jgi:hypothetical protein
MKTTHLILGLLLLSGCGGGGGGSDDDSDNNSNTNSSGTNTGTNLYQLLDDALAQRNVSETDPSGLWIFYGKGSNNSTININGDTSDQDETINLYALVASVFVLDNSGSPIIAIGDCTAEYTGNSLWAGSLQASQSFTQHTMSLNDLRILDSAAYPFNPADILLDMDYQAYLDTDFTVTITDNREMTFPGSFSYTDDEGNFQGDFMASFKARKIADDYNADLGQFVVNAINQDSHCFTFINQFNELQSNTTVNNQTFNQDSSYMYEYYKFASWPSSPDGISGLLYQYTGEQTFDSNGNTSTSPESRHVSMTSTSSPKKFENLIATTGLSNNLVDLTYNFDVTMGLSIDYSLSNGTITHTGTVEALY